MASQQLTASTIVSLLELYKNQQTQLESQLAHTNRIIENLQSDLKEAGVSTLSAVTAPKRKAGRPAGSGAAKKRGRPAGSKNVTGKKRGRPAKVSTSDPSATSDTPTAPKRRGRPPKAAATGTATVSTAPKKRGRPAKAKTAVSTSTASMTDPAAPKRRGRPPKAASGTSTIAAPSAAPKKRGRPAGSKNVAGKKRGRPAKSAIAAKTPAKAPSTKTGARRGRPPGSGKKKA